MHPICVLRSRGAEEVAALTQHRQSSKLVTDRVGDDVEGGSKYLFRLLQPPYKPEISSGGEIGYLTMCGHCGKNLLKRSCLDGSILCSVTLGNTLGTPPPNAGYNLAPPMR